MSLLDATDHGGRRYPNSDGMSNEFTGGDMCIRGDVIIGGSDVIRLRSETEEVIVVWMLGDHALYAESDDRGLFSRSEVLIRLHTHFQKEVVMQLIRWSGRGHCSKGTAV